MRQHAFRPTPSLDSAQLLKGGTAQLQAAGVEQASLDAGLLLAHVLEISREWLVMTPVPVSRQQVSDYSELIERRVKREPLAKILGSKEFWSLSFDVDRSTLDPRPDSESLIELLCELRPDRQAALRMLDLGTGSGCLLLAALTEYAAASGLGIERSAAALEVAMRNAEALGLAARATMRAGDWFAFTPRERSFDVILCNPPYIAESERRTLMPEVADYDPATALFAGADGLSDYRAILPQVAAHLSPGGIAIFEIGAGQQPAVVSLAENAGLALLASKKDLGGVVRALAFQLHNR